MVSTLRPAPSPARRAATALAVALVGLGLTVPAGASATTRLTTKTTHGEIRFSIAGCNQTDTADFLVRHHPHHLRALAPKVGTLLTSVDDNGTVAFGRVTGATAVRVSGGVAMRFTAVGTDAACRPATADSVPVTGTSDDLTAKIEFQRRVKVAYVPHLRTVRDFLKRSDTLQRRYVVDYLRYHPDRCFDGEPTPKHTAYRLAGPIRRAIRIGRSPLDHRRRSSKTSITTAVKQLRRHIGC